MVNRELIELAGKLKQIIPNLISGQSVDCVILGYSNLKLKVLLLKWKGAKDLWTLPGGFIFQDEDIEDAAKRVLKERSGLELSYLDQFYTFGSKNRRNGDQLNGFIGMMGDEYSEIDQWFSQRFTSIGYFALVDIKKCVVSPDVMSEKCDWISIDELPDLLYDHEYIVKKALEHIKGKLSYIPFGDSLLPKKFTMKELQFLYEIILQKKLDRGNFQKKILKLGVLNRHEKKMTGGAYKAPYLYSFNDEKYSEFIEKGLSIVY